MQAYQGVTCCVSLPPQPGPGLLPGCGAKGAKAWAQGSPEPNIPTRLVEGRLGSPLPKPLPPPLPLSLDRNTRARKHGAKHDAAGNGNAAGSNGSEIVEAGPAMVWDLNAAVMVLRSGQSATPTVEITPPSLLPPPLPPPFSPPPAQAASSMCPASLPQPLPPSNPSLSLGQLAPVSHGVAVSGPALDGGAELRIAQRVPIPEMPMCTVPPSCEDYMAQVRLHYAIFMAHMRQVFSSQSTLQSSATSVAPPVICIPVRCVARQIVFTMQLLSFKAPCCSPSDLNCTVQLRRTFVLSMCPKLIVVCVLPDTQSPVEGSARLFPCMSMLPITLPRWAWYSVLEHGQQHSYRKAHYQQPAPSLPCTKPCCSPLWKNSEEGAPALPVHGKHVMHLQSTLKYFKLRMHCNCKRM